MFLTTLRDPVSQGEDSGCPTQGCRQGGSEDSGLVASDSTYAFTALQPCPLLPWASAAGGGWWGPPSCCGVAGELVDSPPPIGAGGKVVMLMQFLKLVEGWGRITQGWRPHVGSGGLCVS